MIRSFVVVTLSAFALFAAGCNTVEGVGEDVEAAGGKIEETANANKPD